MCVWLENLRLFRQSDFPCVHLSKFYLSRSKGCKGKKRKPPKEPPKSPSIPPEGGA